MSSSVDHRLVHLLSASDGVARRRDLVAGGVSSSSIDRRLRSGALRSYGAGIVGTTDGIDPRRQRFRVALLTRPAGVLSHLSAAEIHGVDFERPPRRVHLTIPHGSSRAGRDLIAHQTLHLPESDRTEVDGFAVTSPARTLCDLAVGHELPPTQLAELTRWMLDHERCAPGEVAACADGLDRRGRGGASGRRQLVASLFTRPRVDPDELVDRLTELVEAVGLGGLLAPAPSWYDPTPGVEAVAVPTSRRLLELDARAGDRQLHEVRSDRRRARAAQDRGWRLERIGWAEVVHRPTQLRHDLAHLLGANSVRAA